MRIESCVRSTLKDRVIAKGEIWLCLVTGQNGWLFGMDGLGWLTRQEKCPKF